MVRHDGSEDNTLGPDDCKAHAKLLIYRLFQEGRVLAQDGDRRGPFNDSVNVRFSEAGRITPSDEADF